MMMRMMTQHQNQHHRSSFKLLVVFVVGGIILVFLVGDFFNSGASTSDSTNDQSLLMKSKNSASATIKEKQQTTVERDHHEVEIQQGEIRMGNSFSDSTTSSRNVAYYHCSNDRSSGGVETSTKNAASPVESLVLLHGSAFTKEDWKSSGILKDLCRPSHGTTTATSTTIPLKVTAVDLPVSATHDDLMQLLDAMTETEKIIPVSSPGSGSSQLIESLPVKLVTPSASGKTITDWILNGDNNNSKINLLPTYISTWIPVASNSVDKLSDTQISQLKDLSSSSSFKIFAIYGDQDMHGKKVSKRLEGIGSATILELSGRHPVYLDSPTEFVEAVIRTIDTNQ